MDNEATFRIGGREIKQHQILGMVLLLVGLGLGLYLVQQQQLLWGRAAVDPSRAFEVKDSNGNPLSCSGDTCQTQSLDVQIKVKDLDALIE